ncbi:MAG: hypothetical protein LBT20_01405 [Clostridiales bacterium]|jgi:hypothetical protein|nr:hypothetical protein [Clostridiales bacterium]
MDGYTEIMVDFAEGRITAELFVDVLRSSIDIREILNEKIGRDVSSYILTRNVNSVSGCFSVYSIIADYLKLINVSFVADEGYLERFRFLLDAVCGYLEEDSAVERYIDEKIIKTMPDNLSKTKQIAYCKKRQKELFRYDDKPPRWIQNCEWAFNEKGEPMVFRYQKEIQEGAFTKFLYYFYDPLTGETVEVEQYD